MLHEESSVKGCTFLEASAGTGKTFTLVQMVARLVSEGVALSEILVVTFTRAATRELGQRIHEKLRDEASVFTIHGFCFSMLSEFAFEAGLTPQMTDPDEVDYETFLKAEIYNFLRSECLKELLSPMQLGLLLKRYGDSMDRLVGRLATIVNTSAEIPLGLKFRELEESFPGGGDYLTHFKKSAPAFKGLMARSGQIHQKWIDQVKLLEEGAPLDEFLKEESVFLKLTTANLKKGKEADLGPLAKVSDVIQAASCPDKMILLLACHCREHINRLKEEKEIFSPDDYLDKMLNALDRPAFLKRVRSKFRAAFIDEFQDTDPRQWLIFKKIFLEDREPEAFALIGDPKQSIYGFRGANLDVYYEAAKEIKNHARLNTNYRSDPGLIEAVNRFFDLDVQAPEDKEKGLDQPVTFFVAEGSQGRERSWPTKKMESEQLFPYIASEIKNYAFNDVAILIKDRFQAERLATFLKERGIPTRVKGTALLSETKSFGFFSDLFDVMHSFRDMRRLKRLLAHPFFGYAPDDLLGDLQERVAEMANLHFYLEEKGFGPFFDRVIALVFGQLSLEDYGDLTQMGELFMEMGKRARLEDFESVMKRIKEDEKRRPLSSDEAVSIMTMHLSKGLEFEVVFALGSCSRHLAKRDLVVKDGVWQMFDEEYLERADEEKLRGLYVALTRAKRKLYIPYLIDSEKKEPPAGCKSPIELLVKKCGGLEKMGAVTEVAEDKNGRVLTPKEIDLLEPPAFTRTFISTPIHSFTSLATHTSEEHDEPDEDELPLGAETGTFLHEVIERVIEEGLYLTGDIKRAINPYDERVHKMVEQLFTYQLPGGFSLSEVSPSKMVTELEFLYPAGEEGYMKGFIDLLFSHQNKLYIVDWKSNFLGNDAASYQKEKLKRAMAHNDYFLQANIYKGAATRLYPSEELGGILYFFLRGLKWNQGCFVI